MPSSSDFEFTLDPPSPKRGQAALDRALVNVEELRVWYKRKYDELVVEMKTPDTRPQEALWQSRVEASRKPSLHHSSASPIESNDDCSRPKKRHCGISNNTNRITTEGTSIDFLNNICELVISEEYFTDEGKLEGWAWFEKRNIQPYQDLLEKYKIWQEDNIEKNVDKNELDLICYAIRTVGTERDSKTRVFHGIDADPLSTFESRFVLEESTPDDAGYAVQKYIADIRQGRESAIKALSTHPYVRSAVSNIRRAVIRMIKFLYDDKLRLMLERMPKITNATLTKWGMTE